jgi:hypothetical protein
VRPSLTMNMKLQTRFPFYSAILINFSSLTFTF